jgi:hypothetical protein
MADLKSGAGGPAWIVQAGSNQGAFAEIHSSAATTAKLNNEYRRTMKENDDVVNTFRSADCITG